MPSQAFERDAKARASILRYASQECLMAIERIYISPVRGAAQIECERIAVQTGAGIVGDRNFGMSAYNGQNLTLVEAEELDVFCGRYERALDMSLLRRNLVTRGVRLNDLLNKQFRVGTVLLRGVELCEPCLTVGSLLSNESLSLPAAIEHWVGRGGLRVDVLEGGEICIGNQIENEA
jgi:MOSC domain-containing protein YiiM